MNRTTVTILSGTWLLFAVTLEILTRQSHGTVRTWISVAIALYEATATIFVLAALMRQLLDIINGQRMATLKDLATIGFAYFFVIAAFGTIYLAIENVRTKSFIFTNKRRSYLNNHRRLSVPQRNHHSDCRVRGHRTRCVACKNSRGVPSGDRSVANCDRVRRVHWQSSEPPITRQAEQILQRLSKRLRTGSG